MVCWQYFLSSYPSLFPALEKASGEGEEKEETIEKKKSVTEYSKSQGSMIS